MLAYRLVHDIKIFESRSICPKCEKKIYWYDNIPILSWIILKRKCRHCKSYISILYPFIEILSLIIFLLLYYKFSYNLYFFISYFIFFSALIITIRTDIETMLISSFATIFLIPIAFILSYLNWLPINLNQSIIGAVFGYLLLFIVSKIFNIITKKEGLGQGDWDLLAFIGSFIGIAGSWSSLLIGSILGAIIGIFLIVLGKTKFSNKLPFGPFLAIAAIIFTLYQQEFLRFFGFN